MLVTKRSISRTVFPDLLPLLIAKSPYHRTEYFSVTGVHIKVAYNKSPCRTIVFLRRLFSLDLWISVLWSSSTSYNSHVRAYRDARR
jgi:hypothetical protein